MNTKSSIFKSGEATSENTAVFSRVAKPRVKIPLLVFMSEIKINLTPEKNQIFCFFYAIIQKKLTYFSPSAVTTEH